MIPVTFKHGLGVFAKLQRVATECMLISPLFLGGYFSSGKIILCWHFVFEGFLGMETKKSDLCGAKAVFFKGWVFEGDLQQEPQDLAHLRSAKCGVLGDPSNNKTR